MKTKYEILMVICKNPAITFSEILNKFSLSKGSISSHLKNLENEKLIVKYKNLEEKKFLKIRPTKNGFDIYRQIELEKYSKNIKLK
ncbi:MarR family transcriptional regulator [Cetobacterium somerae]|uniref:MarR family transcriptional regulator n=1 Tax=Cetobacterium somerae TaxID=188913 RepID=UPI00248EA411|nr:MarR family transcriptional regulator [Cetobacterium somerae]